MRRLDPEWEDKGEGNQNTSGPKHSQHDWPDWGGKLSPPPAIDGTGMRPGCALVFRVWGVTATVHSTSNSDLGLESSPLDLKAFTLTNV